MFGHHTILGVQVNRIKGITQGVFKFPPFLVITNRDGDLPFDPKSFPGCSFIHHSVNTCIFTTGNRLEKLEHPKDGLSACQVGLGLSPRISGIRSEDMINITSFATNGLHRFTTPGIPLLQSAFFDRLIVHLLNQLGVFIDYIPIQPLVYHNLSAWLTDISTQTLKP